RHTRSKRDWSSDVCSSDLIIARFGYTATPVDTARGFIYDDDFLRYLDEKENPRHRWGTALSGRPSLLTYWYRQSPQYMGASELRSEERRVGKGGGAARGAR